MLELERTPDGRVEIWLDGRWDADDEPVAADVSLSEDQMNALVIAWLRGPMGSPGPAGPAGARA